jgi:hypothetical protein
VVIDARVYSNTKRWEMTKEEEKQKRWERREWFTTNYYV